MKKIIRTATVPLSLDIFCRGFLRELSEEYQIVVFGDCYITREVIDSIYKAFEHNADVVLKKQKDGVDISEMKKPTRVSKAKVHQGERILKYSEMLRQTQGESEILPFSTAGSHAAAQ